MFGWVLLEVERKPVNNDFEIQPYSKFFKEAIYFFPPQLFLNTRLMNFFSNNIFHFFSFASFYNIIYCVRKKVLAKNISTIA